MHKKSGGSGPLLKIPTWKVGGRGMIRVLISKILWFSCLFCKVESFTRAGCAEASPSKPGALGPSRHSFMRRSTVNRSTAHLHACLCLVVTVILQFPIAVS